ncbi:hypothetical protein H6F98_24850 [Microcoleus sp. FACHB-SPT15]|uniref:hypothetical protein n=1 Tax=Microcoleus sp. FACHB-SPT15 TaxID=2692830 RepID=UPI0017860D8E|nr:hypothetical protein [Microcoleus sp. FACHB-SPT15]MBD1808658.1 hypothetical protein [Microcoleus sp. FACHB-SPT15]
MNDKFIEVERWTLPHLAARFPTEYFGFTPSQIEGYMATDNKLLPLGTDRLTQILHQSG